MFAASAVPESRDDLWEPESFFWQRRPGHYNFGDHLARVIVGRMLHLAVSTDAILVREPLRVFSVGSVLHFARDGDVIWGSGRNGKIPDDAHRFTHLDVRAVRGPLTHRWLSSRVTVPDTLPYGDPALLIPYLFDLTGPLFRPREDERDGDVLVPNLNELEGLEDRPDLRLVLPTRPWYEVLRKILGARRVVTSSLHGLVLAESFGRPVALVRPSPVETDFKYEDYYAGTGRSAGPSLRTFAGAAEHAETPVLGWDPEALVRAFPFDRYGLDPSRDDLLQRMHAIRERNRAAGEA